MLIATNLCPHAHCVELVIGRRWSYWTYHDGEHVLLPMRHGPVHSRWMHSMRRAPARACRVDRARWKRRRFVQSLRSA